MTADSWPVLALVALLVLLGMEGFAWWAHKYVMHRWGWGWHRSHHEPREGLFEKNDLYAVVFAGISIALFAVGSLGYPLVSAVAAGVTLYGFFYFIVHDGLVHQRWPFRHIPHRGYVKRLVQAHRLHHAVRGREDGVSFGFLYAPPIERLQAEMKASGVIRRERGRGDGPPPAPPQPGREARP